MSAKEMFKELGYELINTDDLYVEYKKEVKYDTSIIRINKIMGGSIYKCDENDAKVFYYEEILALAQQIKEIGVV